MGTWLRNPRTTQERRITGKRCFLDLDDYRVKIRPKRNMRNLPCAWEDIPRKDLDHKSWKRHRRTQYKGK